MIGLQLTIQHTASTQDKCRTPSTQPHDALSQYTVQLHTCAPAKCWHTNKPPCQLYYRGLREPNGTARKPVSRSRTRHTDKQQSSTLLPAPAPSTISYAHSTRQNAPRQEALTCKHVRLPQPYPPPTTVHQCCSATHLLQRASYSPPPTAYSLLLSAVAMCGCLAPSTYPTPGMHNCCFCCLQTPCRTATPHRVGLDALCDIHHGLLPPLLLLPSAAVFVSTA